MGQNGQTNMGNLPKRVAIVYDWVDKWGGAERVLLALHEMFPEAPLYTAVYEPRLAGWAEVFPKIIAPKIYFNHELFPWLIPLIFESYSFDEYDLVISVSSFAAKGIITKPHTKHVNYCLTPTRFLWSHEEDYKESLNPLLRFLTKPIFKYLKYWDKIASNRPARIIAISKTGQDRIKKYYGLDSEVIHPPVNIDQYQKDFEKPVIENFFLYVGRLVAYKQVQIIVEVFNELNLPLAIIGLGKLEDKLKSIAKQNIHFLGHLSDDLVAQHLQHAKGLIYFHEEDFGIVPIEAMAAGTPVLGFNKGGVTETVIDGITGVLDSNLENAILRFNNINFDKKVIRNRAELFSKEKFMLNFKDNLCRI